MIVLITASLLAALTVAIHSVGLALLATRAESLVAGTVNFASMVKFLIKVTLGLILLHGIEIAVWALFYYGSGSMSDLESAFYFSGVTYTTVGYGDLVLSNPWRLLGPIEAMTGILMCGLSTGMFFAMVSRIYRAWH